MGVLSYIINVRLNQLISLNGKVENYIVMKSMVVIK